MAIKISIRKLQADLLRLMEAAQSTGFDWLDIKNEHRLAVSDLREFDEHRNPLDRLLAAQSRSEPLGRR